MKASFHSTARGLERAGCCGALPRYVRVISAPQTLAGGVMFRGRARSGYQGSTLPSQLKKPPLSAGVSPAMTFAMRRADWPGV